MGAAVRCPQSGAHSTMPSHHTSRACRSHGGRCATRWRAARKREVMQGGVDHAERGVVGCPVSSGPIELRHDPSSQPSEPGEPAASAAAQRRVSRWWWGARRRHRRKRRLVVGACMVGMEHLQRPALPIRASGRQWLACRVDATTPVPLWARLEHGHGHRHGHGHGNGRGRSNVPC
jgi:hypothetical protein